MAQGTRRKKSASGTQKTEPPVFPTIAPGNWRGEIVGGRSVHFGQIVQEGPPRQSVEFTYMILPATLTMPGGSFIWPAVVIIMAPMPMKVDRPDAGTLTKNGDLPSLTVALDVTRAQFSDMIGLVEGQRLRSFQFLVEEGSDGVGPIKSWGMSTPLGSTAPASS